MSTTPGPVASSERILALDVLRGFALLGVLVVNLPYMALPSDSVASPPGGLDAPFADLAAWVLVSTFFELKFVALFSLLFGMGLVLQSDRAGERSLRVLLRRLAWLALMGVAHGVLLFAGDILLAYAVAGALVLVLRRVGAQAFATLALATWVVSIGLTTAFAALVALGDGRDTPATVTEGAPELTIANALGEGPATAALETRVFLEGPFEDLLELRAIQYVGWLLFSTLFHGFHLRVLALILAGAAAMRAGFLDASHARVHRGLACVLLPLGALLEAIGTTLHVSRGFAHDGVFIVVTLLHELGSVLFAAGLAGAVILFARSQALRGLAGALAAVGRTALTNYLAQSLLGNVLFTWLGLGLFGQLGAAQVLGLSLAIFVVQMGVSLAWLRVFRMGPCEWIWRAVTYGRLPRVRAD